MTSYRDQLEDSPFDETLFSLERALRATSLKVRRTDGGLLIDHPNFSTRVSVTTHSQLCNDLIQAVVDVRSEFPDALIPFLKESGEGAAFNSFATLGAITHEQGHYFVGSRLTIFKQEDAWRVHMPVLLYAVISATESLLGAMHRAFGGVGIQRDKKSRWGSGDLSQVDNVLSRVSVCNSGGLELTAEFGLGEGQISAAVGHKTALWQIQADQPHPEMGGGLMCLLQMPNSYQDANHLNLILGELNRQEMTLGDQPPHFGAWCPGRSGKNPAYISFLPNSMHEVAGIATNFSVWAMHRAAWAHGVLQRLDANVSSTAHQAAKQTSRDTGVCTPATSKAPSAGRTDWERLNLARGILGGGLTDSDLIDLAKIIEAQLSDRPKVLSPRDIEKIVNSIYGRHRSVLYSELERLVQTLHRPVSRF